jgi:hypothetical protein
MMTIRPAAVLIGVIVVLAGCGNSSRAAGPPPPQVVKLEPVIERHVPISVEYVKTLVGYIMTVAASDA